MKKTEYKSLKQLFPFIGIGVLYYILSMPDLAFKFPDGYSELRFTGLVTAAVGMLFGCPGALACALGNLAGDLRSGLDIYCVFGFLGNFSMAWLPYKLWHTLFLGKGQSPRYLDSPGTILKFVLISLLSGCISVGIIASAGHILGGYVYGRFFLPVALQYYNLSILGGMLIFHICTVRFHMVPHIPVAVYRQQYRKNRYVTELVLGAAAGVLAVVLAVLTWNPGYQNDTLVSVLCMLFLTLSVILAVLPMRRSNNKKQNEDIGASEGTSVVYRPVSGLAAHFILLFLIILCAVTVYFTTSTFHMLYKDLSYVQLNGTHMNVLWIRVFINVAVAATILISILSAVLYFVQKNVIEPAGKVTEYAAGFVTDQELSKERLILRKTNTELDTLSMSVDCMAENIRGFVEDIRLRTMKEERLAAELSVARNIQLGMLPGQWTGTGFDLVPYIKPAKEVGGDFYHFVQLDENRVFVCIADVSGKDISAAMFMVQAKTLIDASCALPPNEMFKRVNDVLSKNNQAMMFVTAFAAILDRKERTMIYANAGHNPPICYCDGKVEWLSQEADFVLGPVGNMEYRLYAVEYKENFKLFIYTDGVNEAESAGKDFFGDDRLFECLKETFNSNESSKAAVAKLAANLAEFTKGAEQSDDITMLALAAE